MNSRYSDAFADPFLLERFVEAQEPVYSQALREIQNGRKESHWMWFVFPQLAGLGSSAMAQRYAIKNKEEAIAYLAHRVLGERLRKCCEALLGVEGRTAHEIFGSPDDHKLRSCMTLFSMVSPANSIFEKVLQKYYQGEKDERTLELLKTNASH